MFISPQHAVSSLISGRNSNQSSTRESSPSPSFFITTKIKLQNQLNKENIQLFSDTMSSLISRTEMKDGCCSIQVARVSDGEGCHPHILSRNGAVSFAIHSQWISAQVSDDYYYVIASLVVCLHISWHIFTHISKYTCRHIMLIVYPWTPLKLMRCSMKSLVLLSLNHIAFHSTLLALFRRYLME
jgi:hypothetical protein